MHLQLSLLLAILPAALANLAAKRSVPAPVLTPRGEGYSLVPDEYIVRLKKDSSLAALENALNVFPEMPVVFLTPSSRAPAAS